MATNSSASWSSHSRRSFFPRDLAVATLSQYLDSRLSFNEIAFFEASSRRLYEAFDSSRLAPIELPASNSWWAICRTGPGVRAKMLAIVEQLACESEGAFAEILRQAVSHARRWKW